MRTPTMTEHHVDATLEPEKLFRIALNAMSTIAISNRCMVPVHLQADR